MTTSPDSRVSALDLTHNDDHWMRQTLALAMRAEREAGEVPVAAILVGADGQQISAGWNRCIVDHDPTAHAEIVALRSGGREVGNYRMPGTTLYVTLEPCAMCAMALIHARVARVVFATSDPKTGACGSVFDLMADPRHNHRVMVTSGILADEAGELLRDFFRRKRSLSRT